MDILQIIGTRPQYEKLIRFPNDAIIDTGQHYSSSLVLDRPDVDLRLYWSGIRAAIRAIEFSLEYVKPKLIIVYGDTYSTLIGALVAKRLYIPLAHIEACVPYTNNIESRIRRRVDKISKFLFCPSERAYQASMMLCYRYIQSDEGWFTSSPTFRSSYFVGDLMYDTFLKNNTESKTWNVGVMTIHRRENLEDLQLILNEASKEHEESVIHFFVHPHTAKYIEENEIVFPKNIHKYEPCDRLEMLEYLKQSKFVITDSGGLVREAYWSGVPFKYIGINPWPETEAFGKGDAAEKIKEIVSGIIRAETF